MRTLDAWHTLRIHFGIANFSLAVECRVRWTRVAQHLARTGIAHEIFGAIGGVGLTHARRTRQHLNVRIQQGAVA